jgi:endonuclease/exonuclease/phosphatase (EEP) superfamily protein YafD
MHRQPFVASFQTNVLAVSGQQPFSFTLINVHTDPDETSAAKGERNEISVLAHVYKNVRAYMYPEDDVIILGDFNASPRDLGEFQSLYSTAGTEYTMTTANKQNDYILIDPATTSEFIYGHATVLDYQRDLRIDLETAKSVSDHRPVWAEFQIYEAARAAPPVATRAALP